VFFEHQVDPEAARLANFPSRDREGFMTHWRTKVLGDPTVFVQTVTVDGEPAGSVVAWWDEDRRFVGYWFGRQFWGRGIGTRALTQFLEREETRPLFLELVGGDGEAVEDDVGGELAHKQAAGEVVEQGWHQVHEEWSRQEAVDQLGRAKLDQHVAGCPSAHQPPAFWQAMMAMLGVVTTQVPERDAAVVTQALADTAGNRGGDQ
jgi:hypothetical protein